MNSLTPTTAIPMNRFGKDHWSTFAYVETCCVDANVGEHMGKLQHSRMRSNGNTHPLLNANGLAWRPEWGTRLFGYFEAKKKQEDVNALGLVLDTHDDWDCLDDLEVAGLVDVINLTQGVVKLTSKGLLVAAQLREHKAKGGQFAGFVAQDPTPQPNMNAA